MKLSLILLLLILSACNMPDATATPGATDTRTPTQSSTPTPSPTITPTLWIGEHLLPAGFDRCVWTSNQEVVPLYNDHYSGSVSTLVIVFGSTVRFTGHYTDFVWDIGKFAQVSHVDGEALDVWVRLTNEERTKYFFETDGTCTLIPKPLPTFTVEATPTEEAPQATATPEYEAWQVVVETLNIRPDCSTNAARIGTAAQGQILATFPGAVIANGFEWRRLAASQGCIAVRAAGGTVYAREIVQ